MEALDNYFLTILAELPSPLQKVSLRGFLWPCCVQEPATSLAHLPMGTLGLELPQGPAALLPLWVYLGYGHQVID